MEIKYKDGRTFKTEFFSGPGHNYQVSTMFEDGTWSEPVPTHGVTTPLDRTVSKPFIKPWVAKVTSRVALETIKDMGLTVAELSEFLQKLDDFENEVVDPATGRTKVTYYHMKKHYPWYFEIKQAADRAAEDGKTAGTWLHENIQKFYESDRKHEPLLDPSTRGMWESFLKFDNMYKPKMGRSEFMVYSANFHYSGTADGEGVMSGKKFICDYKSTNRSKQNPMGITYENFYQLGGLAQAEFERTGEWPDDVCIINISKEGDDPIVLWASDWGMSPKELARRYIAANLVPYKNQVADEYKFMKEMVK